jgi:NADH dehydrogenase
VELSGAIAEIARQTLKHDFRSIHPEEAQIILIDGAPRVLPTFPEDLSEKAAQLLGKLGVQIRTSLMVKDIDKEGVNIQAHDGVDRLEARTVIWAGGVAVGALGKTLAKRTQAETNKAGQIKVGPNLTIAGYPDIYVVGDLALSIGVDGKPLPGVAQVAMQQGAYAAKAIVRKLQSGTDLPPFKYFDKGSLAVIGRWAAVADAFGVHLSGFPAWFVWAFIHLLYIVQFQSRILVLVQWALQDLTFSRGARLITGGAATDFNFNQEMAAVEKRSSEPDRIAANQ